MLLITNSTSISFLQIILLIVFLEGIVLSINDDFLNFYQVYLFTFFLFLLSRVFLDIIGIGDFRILNLFQQAYLSERDSVVLLKTLIVYLLGNTAGWMTFRILSKNSDSLLYFSNEPKFAFNDIIYNLFYLFTSLYFIKVFYMVRIALEYGYISAVFGGIIANYQYPLFLRGVGSISEWLFILNLFYNRDEKRFKKVSMFYLFTLFFRSFTGQRGGPMLFLLVVIWIYNNYYHKIKIRTASICALVVVVFSNLIYIVRSSNSYTSSIFNMKILDFFVDQGISITVVGNTIKNLSLFNNKKPFFLGYFYDFFDFSTGGEITDKIVNKSYLGDHLTYMIAPHRFIDGYGTGTSQVAEFYELVNGNLFLLFFTGFAFLLFVSLIINKTYKNVYWFTLSFYTLYYFFFSPRDSIGKVFGKVLPIILVFILVSLINGLLYDDRNKKKIVIHNKGVK